MHQGGFPIPPAELVVGPLGGELGTEVYSTDEMTGVQALERKYQDKSVCPGRSALYEFEYVRQGTLSLIASLRIADGTTHAPYINKTRNEQDFCHAVRQLVEQSPDKTYIIICDGLNTHKSESLVRLTAETMPSPR